MFFLCSVYYSETNGNQHQDNTEEPELVSRYTTECMVYSNNSQFGQQLSVHIIPHIIPVDFSLEVPVVTSLYPLPGFLLHRGIIKSPIFAMTYMLPVSGKNKTCRQMQG